jgi:hypothetical protein
VVEALPAGASEPGGGPGLLQAPDGHRLFNRYLRENYGRDSRRNRGGLSKEGIITERSVHRPLQGVHDVLPFLDSLRGETPYSSRYPGWGLREPPEPCVQRFLQRFKGHRGSVPALRAELEAQGLLSPITSSA